jgi:glycosyltransferase involved in cell wall biosynthesis
MTLRRLVIINDFSLKRGGATGLAVLCAQWMRDAGVRVTYISGDDGKSATLAGAGIEHIALGNRPFALGPRLSGVMRGVWNRDTERDIAAWIARNDDAGTVYHLHGWHSILSPSVFAALRSVYARTLVHAHDFFLVCPNGAFMNFPQHRVCELAPLTAACVASNCDRRHYSHKVLRVLRQEVQNRTRGAPLDVLLIHPGMRRFFERSGWPSERLFCVPNPCVPFSRERIAAHQNRGFFFVGRLDEEKGARDFAEAATRAGVPAVIVGEGPERAGLERAYPNVEFTGWRGGAEIGRLMRRARCLVMPSRYPEPFGLVAVEALGSGIPVIAAAHCLIANDLAGHGMGLAIDTRDHGALAAALRRVERDDGLVRDMSERALRHVGQLCSTTQDWGHALLEHYERLLSSKPSVAAEPDRAVR